MVFKASMDKFTKIVTIVISILFTGIVFFPFMFAGEKNYELYSVLSFFLASIYLFCYMMRPTNYEITNTKIIVKRMVSDVSLNLSDVKEIKQFKNVSFMFSFRLFGVGGLFGYFGKFWDKEYGTMTYYATKNGNAIMIITNENKKIVITPDECDAFLEHFLKMNKIVIN